MTADSGTPPATLFAMVMRSGSTPGVLDGEQTRRCAAKPDWISSAIITMPCWSQSARSLRSNSPAPRYEATFTEHRLDDDGRRSRGSTSALKKLLDRLRATAPPSPRAKGHGIGQVIDLRQHRPEASLVGLHLPREADARQRAPVKAAAERDHRRALRVKTGDLDGVLDGFRACVVRKIVFLRTPRPASARSSARPAPHSSRTASPESRRA